VSAAHVDCEQHRGTAGTASAIYEGTVRHRRFAVRSHEFSQRVALAYVDLDELPGLLGGRLLRGRAGLARFRRSDYLGAACVPLADAVRDTVRAHGRARPSGPVRLLANLSAFGHCFNPVSFYYCMDPAGEQVQAVVAEVTNTPWGERRAYVLSTEVGAGRRVGEPDARSAGESDARSAGQPDAPPMCESNARSAGDPGAPRAGESNVRPSGRVLAASFDKALHVSPFMGMDHRYEWRMTVPAQTLSVHIASSREGRLAFDATLSLRRRELTKTSLVRLTTSTLRTLVSIYVQAATLRLKGVPVHPHPGVSAV
jgi:uncharacterized protein